jgi:hypothetical protein
MSPLDLVLPEAPRDTVPFSVRLAERRVVVARPVVRPSERRAHRRWTVKDLEWLKAVRLKGGAGLGVSLIDLSERGALIEVDGPLRPGVKLTLELIGSDLEAAVPLEVLRSYVASLRGGSTYYRGACIFAHAIELPGGGPQRTPSAPFVGTDAALAYLIERCALGTAEAGPLTPRVRLAREQLLHVLESLLAKGSSRSDAAGLMTLELLGAVLPALQRGASRGDALAALECRLRTMPARAQSELQPSIARLALLIDHCLPVETPRPQPVASEIDAARNATTETDAARAIDRKPAAQAVTQAGSAFQKIVVRYADGQIVKGFTQDFHPSRGQFSLWPSINARPSERVIVPVEKLKALFFVRNFEGNPGYRERKTFTVRGQGRRVEVTFTDTEVILGTTLNYRPDGQGFFVTPADPAANNTRIFVVAASVKRVRFL